MAISDEGRMEALGPEKTQLCWEATVEDGYCLQDAAWPPGSLWLATV